MVPEIFEAVTSPLTWNVLFNGYEPPAVTDLLIVLRSSASCLSSSAVKVPSRSDTEFADWPISASLIESTGDRR